MKDGKFDFLTFLNNFENYAATICFFIISILLTFQVFTRYIVGHSVTWMEEAATLLFVWMIYFGVAGAVLARKHLKIEFILDIVPFKVKRILLILDNVIFAFFNIFICFPLFRVIKMLGSSVTTMLKIPKQTVYMIIPVMLVLSVIRLIQDTIKLTKESKQELGISKPSLDLDACVREYNENQIKLKSVGEVK